MRTAPASFVSHHRLARLTAWARLWLVWFVGAFVCWLGATPAPRQTRDHLNAARRILGRLIFLQAAARMRAPPKANHRHGRLKQRAIKRALIGSRLRRALTGKGDCYHRLGALLTAWRDTERHFAALMRRLRRGLTRLRTIAPVRARAERLHTLHLECAGADTS
jgi:hypothetical protein